MKTQDFNYNLPKELIAQEPLDDRTSSRLLVLDKQSGKVTHRNFKDILSYLSPGDCIVINDTKVIPARLIGNRKNTGGAVEILLLTRKGISIWEVLVNPGKKAKPGDIIVFGEGKLEAEIIEVVDGGNRIVKFYYDGVFENVLDELGEMPLPPYITHRLKDKNRYQTVYAKTEGSAAAPTAGLHFTQELLEDIKRNGVGVANITLHVGLGTFRPVKVEDVTSHKMHSEYFIIDEKQAEIINKAKRNGGRVISVGTTTARTLESCAGKKNSIVARSGWTDIFIYPGYEFKVIDGLITNFHLPESTLIMLVSAIAGKENVLNAYQVAVEEKYRFFSFGDAMFIV